MAGEENAPLIESRADLLEVMAVGGKPKSEWRVGTEHEKHVYRKAPLAPVPYAGDDGVHALLRGIEARTGWHPFFDRGNPIGLRNLGAVGGISLEPGGQFELSGAPQLTIHDAAAELDAHLEDCRVIGGPLNIHFLGLGVTPLWSVAEIAAMPKSRYGIMTRYMQQVGTLGTSMMYGSATVQANLDFSDEADMVKKLRVSVALQPIVTALFANSPFVDGKPSGYLSFRSHIWLNTDNARTGMLPFAFEPGFGFDRYAAHALAVPMYFFIRIGEYIETSGAKGTVEKISVRSVTLRNPRGPVATIPYGQISKVVNFSRDWAIEKIQFRLAFDTDMEVVRKLFKKIGQDLLTNPELSPGIIETFKSQGIANVEDGTLVVRGKFTAKPADVSGIRREVLKAVHHAFRENGIKVVPKPLTGDAPAPAA